MYDRNEALHCVTRVFVSIGAVYFQEVHRYKVEVHPTLQVFFCGNL